MDSVDYGCLDLTTSMAWVIFLQLDFMHEHSSILTTYRKSSMETLYYGLVQTLKISTNRIDWFHHIHPKGFVLGLGSNISQSMQRPCSNKLASNLWVGLKRSQ